MSPRRGFGFLAVLSALVCAGLATACGNGPGAGRDAAEAASDTAPPNILLIVVDTLGAEWVGAYESPLSAGDSPTPHLDALARRGVRFQHAYTPAPWTQPAVASLLSGRMPSEHGLVRLFGTVAEDLPWLPQSALDGGFVTAGVVSHKLVGRRYGFARGFASWDESVAGGARPVTSARVTTSALERLEEWYGGSSAQRPFFLLVHYFDPHYVYRHHSEYDRSGGYSGPLTPGMNIWQLRDRRTRLTPGDVGFLRGLYREEIAYTDAQLGRLLDGLERLGVADRTAIVVTSDHGEELMRHGWIGHTRTLYDELLRVPLLIVPPAGGPPPVHGVEEPVSLIDLAPTLAEIAGLPAAGLGVPGLAGQDPISLAPLLAVAPAADGAAADTRQRLRERALLAEVSFAAVQGDDARQGEKTAFKIAAFDARYKVIRDLASGSWEVFDRADDPEELRPLDDPAALGAAVERLVRRVQQLEAERGGAGSGSELLTPSDEEIERLRALGYLR